MEPHNFDGRSADTVHYRRCLSPLFRSTSDKAIQWNNHLQTSNLGSMYGVLWCNLNLICIAMKHPVHRRHLKLLAFTRTFNIFLISNVISSQLNTVNCKLHCTLYIVLKYWTRMCSSFCQKIHNTVYYGTTWPLNRFSVLWLLASISSVPCLVFYWPGVPICHDQFLVTIWIHL